MGRPAHRYLAIGLAIVLGGCISVASQEERDASFTVGERWTYKHEGPKPWGDGSTSIRGDRTVEVLAIVGQGGQQRWIVEEKFGETDPDAMRMHIDANRCVVAQELVNSLARLVPPFPLEYSRMPIGEKVVSKYTLVSSSDGGRSPIQVVSKRSRNQSIQVPAGRFKDCLHVTNEITAAFDGGRVTVRCIQEIWYSAKVNGVVKETYVFNPAQMGDLAIPEYRCISTLKTYGIKSR